MRKGRGKGEGEEGKGRERGGGGKGEEKWRESVSSSSGYRAILRCFVSINKTSIHDPLTSFFLSLILGAQYLHAPLISH